MAGAGGQPDARRSIAGLAVSVRKQAETKLITLLQMSLVSSMQQIFLEFIAI